MFFKTYIAAGLITGAAFLYATFNHLVDNKKYGICVHVPFVEFLTSPDSKNKIEAIIAKTGITCELAGTEIESCYPVFEAKQRFYQLTATQSVKEALEQEGYEVAIIEIRSVNEPNPTVVTPEGAAKALEPLMTLLSQLDLPPDTRVKDVLDVLQEEKL